MFGLLEFCVSEWLQDPFSREATAGGARAHGPGDRHAGFHLCADPHGLLLFILFWGKCLGVNSRFLKLICFRGILFKRKWTILNFGMIPYTFYEDKNRWLVIWKHFSMKMSAFYANQSYKMKAVSESLKYTWSCTNNKYFFSSTGNKSLRNDVAKKCESEEFFCQ